MKYTNLKPTPYTGLVALKNCWWLRTVQAPVYRISTYLVGCCRYATPYPLTPYAHVAHRRARQRAQGGIKQARPSLSQSFTLSPRTIASHYCSYLYYIRFHYLLSWFVCLNLPHIPDPFPLTTQIPFVLSPTF